MIPAAVSHGIHDLFHRQRARARAVRTRVRSKASTTFASNGSPIAKEGLKRIAQLYKIEDRIRGEPPPTRQFVRWTESAPLVNAFGVWLDERRSRVSPRSRLGEKLT